MFVPVRAFRDFRPFRGFRGFRPVRGFRGFHGFRGWGPNGPSSWFCGAVLTQVGAVECARRWACRFDRLHATPSQR